jgi:predicted nucleotidyltransferase component of viral defense system
MIDFLQQQIAEEASGEAKINRLRETLQLVCLKILHDKGYFSKMAFVGGTALRIIYDMKRFSEDMDFSVIDKNGYDFSGIIADLKREFSLRGLNIEAKTRVEKTVQDSMLKFPGLLKELSLSDLGSHKLSIKLETDSNPPEGADIESTVVNKIYVLNITHLSLPSLYATKLHACFFRRYTKGRDFYDLIWYLGKKIKPNY